MPDFRRFTPPWTVIDIGSAWVVTDASGQRLYYSYYEEEPGRRSTANLLTRDDARRLAIGCARLPEMLGATDDQDALFKMIESCERAADALGLETVAFLMAMARKDL